MPLKILADKFQPVWLYAAEAFDSERQALVGMIGDREDATREVVALRPNVQQRLFALTAHFPGKTLEGRGASAIFADLHEAEGGEFLQAGFKFSSEFHGRII